MPKPAREDCQKRDWYWRQRSLLIAIEATFWRCLKCGAERDCEDPDGDLG